jgi:aromatic-L-amino-acid decarboxylase
MPPEELRLQGHRVYDWIAEYFEHIEEYPVLARVAPGEVAARLPAEAPEGPTAMEEILRDFREVVLPGITHWNHPGLFAYLGITGSGRGVVG